MRHKKECNEPLGVNVEFTELQDLSDMAQQIPKLNR